MTPKEAFDEYERTMQRYPFVHALWQTAKDTGRHADAAAYHRARVRVPELRQARESWRRVVRAAWAADLAGLSEAA